MVTDTIGEKDKRTSKGNNMQEEADYLLNSGGSRGGSLEPHTLPPPSFEYPK